MPTAWAAWSVAGLPDTSPFAAARRQERSLLVLLGSPTHGAPQAYRRLKFGLDPLRRPGGDGLFGLALADAVITGLDRDLIQTFISAYELLPTRYFCEQKPSWLRFSARGAGLRDASKPNRLYTDAVTGIQGRRADVAAGLAARARLDKELGCYMPNPT